MYSATGLRFRSSTSVAIAAVAALCLLLIAGAAEAGAATVKRFTSTGAQQFFAVPDGVTNLHVVAIGGRGGRGAGPSSALGGFGGVMTADLSVTPGEVLVLNVAGNGGDGGGGGQPGAEGAGGFNAGGAGGRSGDLALGRGGGGGGGMSDVRPAGGALLNGLIFAGGGAGAGGGANGGGGGNAASGGTLGGGNGATGATSGVNPGGIGASGAPASCFVLGPNGQPGALGAGAAGQGGAAMVSAGGGGGGGGGLIGGNGGVTGSGGGSNGGGGGAGSGGFNSTRAKNTSYVLDNTGVPSVTLTYELPGTPGGGTQGGTGGPGGGTQGGGTTGRPVVSALKLAPSEFVAARRGGPTGGTQGTTVTYRSSVAARTVFTVLAARSGIRTSEGRCVKRRSGRRGRSCTRYVSIGTFSRSSVAGFNTFVFSGRLNGRKLPSGRYKLQAVTRTDAGSSSAVSVSFRIAT